MIKIITAVNNKISEFLMKKQIIAICGGGLGKPAGCLPEGLSIEQYFLN